MQISKDESKKSIFSLVESMESGEISFSSSQWSDELFVTCLNDNSENKIEITIKNYLDLFINTSLSINSLLVSQPKNKLVSNSEQ